MTPVTCTQCKAPFAVYGVEPPLEYVCGDCTDPLGGPPVLSPLEERVVALEAAMEPCSHTQTAAVLWGALGVLRDRIVALEESGR